MPAIAYTLLDYLVRDNINRQITVKMAQIYSNIKYHNFTYSERICETAIIVHTMY